MIATITDPVAQHLLALCCVAIVALFSFVAIGSSMSDDF
jgi:hypothetical protein